MVERFFTLDLKGCVELERVENPEVEQTIACRRGAVASWSF